MPLNTDSIPVDRFKSIRTRAERVFTALDTPLSPDEDSTKYLAEHLRDCLKHPTTGLMAYNDAFINRGQNYPGYYRRNLEAVKKFPNIKNLMNALNDKLKELYPKTRKARDFIIETNRIRFDVTEETKHNFRRLFFKTTGF